jgi:Mg-chelatase subunit ChlD
MTGRLFAGMIGLCLVCGAQETVPAREEPPRFAGGTTEVILPVTVVDENGRFVSNLDVQDFKVYDEGREQKITHFSRERSQPVVVGFILDLSNSNKRYWDKFKDAARELVFTLLPGGDKRFSGYLITYADVPELVVDTTDDSQVIADRIEKLKPGGGAALFDAIYMAMTRRKLNEGEPIEPRRILVIIGDGHDSASQKSLREVLELAQRNLVTIYGMSTAAFGFSVEGEENLKRLCEDSGGRVVYPMEGLYSDVSGYLSKPSDAGNYALEVGSGQYTAAILKGIFDSVVALAGEVTTQYIVVYRPDAARGSDVRRDIHVVVNLPGVTVRTRQYYYPNLPPPAAPTSQ